MTPPELALEESIAEVVSEITGQKPISDGQKLETVSETPKSFKQSDDPQWFARNSGVSDNSDKSVSEIEIRDASRAVFHPEIHQSDRRVNPISPSRSISPASHATRWIIA